MSDYLVIKAIGFTTAFMPILVSTVRRGTIPNIALGVLLTLGLAFAIFEAVSGRMNHDFLGMALQIVVAGIVMLGGFAVGWLGAGAAKLCVAVVPWFTLDEYLGALALMFGIFLFEVRVRQMMRWQVDTIQLAPPVALAGCIVLLFPLLGR